MWFQISHLISIRSSSLKHKMKKQRKQGSLFIKLKNVIVSVFILDSGFDSERPQFERSVNNAKGKSSWT